MASGIFSPIGIGTELLENRIAIAPMCQYAARGDGLFTDWHTSHYLQMATAGAGMVVFESTSVSEEGRISLNDLGLYSDEQFERIARFIRIARDWTGTKIGVQLSHAGRKGRGTDDLGSRGANVPPRLGHWPLVSASPIPLTPGSTVPTELALEDLDKIRRDFVRAAQYAYDAGFDFVEVHMAHGYLLHQFISPISNRRQDEFGGSLENRIRFPVEVFAAIREIWRSRGFVGARITGTDWLDGGIDTEEAASLASVLKAKGAGYVCVSSGGIIPITNMVRGPLYQVPLARLVRNAAGICTRAVGCITTFSQAEEVVSSGSADIVAIGREYIRNPRWIWNASRSAGISIGVPKPYSKIYSEFVGAG